MQFYAGATEDTSVLLVDTWEDSSSPRGFLPQNTVVSMQLRNCREIKGEKSYIIWFNLIETLHNI